MWLCPLEAFTRDLEGRGEGVHLSPCLLSLGKQARRDAGVQCPALWVSRARAGQLWGADPWVAALGGCSLSNFLVPYPPDHGSSRWVRPVVSGLIPAGELGAAPAPAISVVSTESCTELLSAGNT